MDGSERGGGLNASGYSAAVAVGAALCVDAGRGGGVARDHLNHFERKVQPELKVVLSGQLVLIPAAELERWVQRNARRIVPRATGARLQRATDSR